MFACRDATELMTDEREGALKGSRGLWYRLHMRICPYCRTCRRQMDEVVALAKETRREAAASDVEARVLAALRERAPKAHDPL